MLPEGQSPLKRTLLSHASLDNAENMELNQVKSLRSLSSPIESTVYRELQKSDADMASDHEIEDEKAKSEVGEMGKFRHSCNYVDMSSGETIDAQQPSPDLFARQRAKKLEFEKNATKPVCKNQRDEGYNSSSHSSGENAPLIHKPIAATKQDEAGYEVPHVVIGKDVDTCKKRSMTNFWKRHSSLRSLKTSHYSDDRNNYYDPPSDSRDIYFLPKTNYHTLRFFICLLCALIVSLGLLMTLYLVAALHIVVCVSITLLFLTIMLILPTTLSNRSILCTFSLVLPSIVSSRSKAAVVLLILLLLLLGPALGIADKFNAARNCHAHIGNTTLRTSDTVVSPNSEVLTDVTKKCIFYVAQITGYCYIKHDNFVLYCHERSHLNSLDRKICEQSKFSFCNANFTTQKTCMLDSKVKTTPKYLSPTADFQNSDIVVSRNVLLYFMPLLALLWLSEAYRYNKSFLTTKNEDNVYITHNFKVLDSERKNRGLTDFVIPLSRIEFKKYIMRKSMSLTNRERRDVIKWLLLVVALALVALCFILLDNATHDLLTAVVQAPCKPILASYTHRHYRVCAYVLLGVLILFIAVQSHVLRTRGVICAFFYKEITDIRSKHLYYAILHDRHTFAKHMRRKIQLLSERKRLAERISFASKIFDVLPIKLQRLCLRLAVRKCMVCDSSTYYKTVECKEKTCKAHYCFECYVDAGQACLTCQNDTMLTRQSSKADSVAV